MSPHNPGPAPTASKIAERLLAHARLCRQIAEATWSEDVAQKLGLMADECTRAAAEVYRDGGGDNATTH
jgi:hypothetical protein